MGTRADFYVGTDPGMMEWLGSIAYDGYPDGIPSDVLRAESEPAYRAAVARFIAKRDDGTTPDHGWPWPWDNSLTTDYAYTYAPSDAAPIYPGVSQGNVLACYFGRGWFVVTDDQPENNDDLTPARVPDMRDRKSVTLGRRSGLMFIG